MWVWMVYAIVYFVFYIHLVGSAMLYRWYLANEKWLRKTLIDEELAYEEGYTEGYGGAASSTEERVSLLDAFGGAGSGGGARSMVDDDEVDALFSGALPTSSAGGAAQQPKEEQEHEQDRDRRQHARLAIVAVSGYEGELRGS